MQRLGLVRDIDLALHLPLRYEDETRLTRVADARDGDTVQVEGVVASPLATGIASLTAEERDLGVALVEFGAGATTKVRLPLD